MEIRNLKRPPVTREADIWRGLSTIIKVLSVALIGVSLASTLSMATDATWYCSTSQLKNFKFVVHGNELTDMMVWQNETLEAVGSAGGGPPGWLEPPKKYQIVDETNIGLVAVLSESNMEKGENRPNAKPTPTVYVEVIAINKMSGTFRQRSFSTSRKKSEDFDEEGTCQVGQ
jgi:hypothetical protein